MDISRIRTYGDAPDRAFEAFCAQLFKSWLKRDYEALLTHFSIVNGDGGDGGVEAYCVLKDEQVIGLQCKWFIDAIDNGQVNQIRKSINSAKDVRRNLSIYIVCLPRTLASLKKGKAGKNIKVSEEMRLQQLKSEMEQQHTGLEIRYWLQENLIEEVQRPENEGVSRYWLNEEIVTFDNLKFRFKMAKDSWLKERYTPISLSGGIANVIEEMVQTPAFIDREIEGIEKIIDGISACRELVGEYRLLNTYFPEVNQVLEDGTAPLEIIKAVLSKVSCQLRLRQVDTPVAIPQDVDLHSAIEILSVTPTGNLLRNVVPRLHSSLRDLHAVHLKQYIERLVERLAPHNQIILGPVGTGKTHGIAKATEQLLDADIPAILIRAKGTVCSSWGEILAQTLGGGKWTDLQLFNGLQALALRMSVNRAFSEKGEKFKDHSVRLLIAVDGVDESTPTDWNNWEDRVKECPSFMKSYPMIRFLISSRSYPPTKMNPCRLFYDDKIQRRYDVAEEGDASLFELIPIYLKEYNISYEENSWILHSFENAITLRLFCEANQGCKISAISASPVYFTLADLFVSKIKRVDAEFLRDNRNLVAEDSQVTHHLLMELGDLFQAKLQVDKAELLAFLLDRLQIRFNPLVLEKAVDKIVEHAFLQKQIEIRDLEPTRFIYSIGIESYLEYFIAIRQAQQIVKTGSMLQPEFLKAEKNKNVRYLTAVILLADHGLLVGEDGLWNGDFEESELVVFQFEILKRCPGHIVKKYLSLVEGYFLRSEIYRNLTIDRFILPNIDREELALGMDFVHRIMSSFDSVYQRDHFWSGPDDLDSDGSSPVSLYLEYVHLSVFDPAKATPLLLAWSLASLDKQFRGKVREELLHWAMHDLGRFVELLELMFTCGDPQIQEDLAIVILGISADLEHSAKNIDILVSWIMENIFSSEKIGELTNAVVRHCCRTLIERAYKLDICTQKQWHEVQSPYAAKAEYLKLDFPGGHVSNVRDGRYPIKNDLYWNVIEKAYDGFLTYKGSGVLDDRAKDFMTPYNQHYGNDFSPKEFAVAAALVIIRNLGWQKSKGFADQGGTRYASYEEKYTWCAVHSIQGFLADRLPFEDNSEPLRDYGRIVSVHNPAEYHIGQQVVNYPNDKIRFFLPEDFAEKLDHMPDTIAEDVRAWVQAAKAPSFGPWTRPDRLGLNGIHSCDDQWITLYCHTALPEINELGRARLRMICLLVPEDESEAFSKFILADDTVFEHSSIAPDDFFAGIEGGVYQSLKDVLWMDSIKEYSDGHELSDDRGIGAEVLTTVTEINENRVGNGQRRFVLPSELVRKSLGIMRGDKRGFFNTSGNLKALMFEHVERPIQEQQLTVADRRSFERMLKEEQLRAFWLFEHYRTTTDAKLIKANYAEFQHCRKWVFFGDSGEFREIYSDEHC